MITKAENSSLPKSIIIFFSDVAEVSRFTARFFKEGLKPPYELREVLRQCYEVGYKSLPLISVTGLIMGMVLIMQSRPTMVEFGAGAYLPSMSAVSIVREIGPLITALVCAGKISSGIAAELGSMKVTEQIDAMEVSGTNPFRYLVATRLVATTIMIPLLTIYADGISIFGSFIGANIKGSISFTLFFRRVFDTLEYGDLMPAVIKSFFFGFAIGLIGCTKGYNSKKGTEGVGNAANSSVVVSMLLVIIIEMVATQISGLLGLI